MNITQAIGAMISVIGLFTSIALHQETGSGNYLGIVILLLGLLVFAVGRMTTPR